MFEDLASLLYAELSADEALRHAREIHQLEYRYSYKNYRKSARYCASVLRDIGLSDVELALHPADGVTKYMDCVMPMAWDVRGARLELIVGSGGEAEVLADWNDDPFCIAQWSTGTGPRGVDAEVVTEEAMWAGADVRGRIVLNATHHHPRQIKKAVAERGGVGVVSDWTENYLDTPDGIYWNNEWSQSAGGWYGGQEEDLESPIWCVSITPRKGAHVRKLIATRRLSLRMRAVISTRLYKGTLPTVTGIIPGTSKSGQEILLIAHIYEPMPSDDAAGAANILEIVRTISRLVKKGKLPAPRRTIRVIFNQEMHGLTAYLANHPKVRKSAIAAVNLDAPVAFLATGQPVAVYMNPGIQASFTDPLFKGIAAHCMASYAPSVAWTTRAHWGDDNFICDPTIGIPVNWLIPPTGTYHHNTINDWSIVDAETLRVAMTVSGTFAHFVSTAGSGEAASLGSQMVTDARSKIENAVAKLLPAGKAVAAEEKEDLGDRVRQRLDYLQFTETKRLNSLKKLSPSGRKGKGGASLPRLVGEVESFARDALAKAERRLNAPRSRRRPSREEFIWRTENNELLAQNITPTRKTMGPMVNYHRIPQPLRLQVAGYANSLALMWTDGRRNLLEISRMVAEETGGGPVNLRNLVRFYRALARYGYIDIRYAKILTKADFKRALKRIGVRKNDVLFLHSSLSHCGPVRGGPNMIIDTLMEVLSPGGTLLMPTNYDNGVIATAECGVTYKYPPDAPFVAVPWDPEKSPAYTGAIPNAFWPRKDVLRSHQPTHSVAAWGKYAKEFVEGHGPGAPCFDREGPYGKMVDYNGKFLHLACNAFSFLHAVEDWADTGYMPTASVLMQQGDKVVTVESIRYPEGCRGTEVGWPSRISRKMEELGIRLKCVPFGFSHLRLVRARTFHRMLPVVQEQRDFLLCEREGCKFCTWARKQALKRQRARKRRLK